jgi:hypothetical protein
VAGAVVVAVRLLRPEVFSVTPITPV